MAHGVRRGYSCGTEITRDKTIFDNMEGLGWNRRKRKKPLPSFILQWSSPRCCFALCRCAWRSELTLLGGGAGAWLALLGWHFTVQPQFLAQLCGWKIYRIYEAGTGMIRGRNNLSRFDGNRLPFAASSCRVSTLISSDNCSLIVSSGDL